MPPARGQNEFHDTRWTLIARLRDTSDSETSERAIEELCKIYWQPLYVYARKFGLSPECAEDATQDFFENVIREDLFSQAAKSEGKLRTWLLKIFHHDLIDLQKRKSRTKRGGSTEFVFIDATGGESARAFEIESTQFTPEQAFDHSWAVALLQRCFDELRKKYVNKGKSELFEQLHPNLSKGNGLPTAELARLLNTSEGAIRIALHRMRQEFREFVRKEVRSTIGIDESIDNEVLHLQFALDSSVT